jgi:hypothetical protein
MSHEQPPEAPAERKPRLPVCPETHRESIHEFLTHFDFLFERELNDLKALSMQYRTASYQGQLSYTRNKLATVRALLAYNEQRRKRVKLSRAR